MGERLKSLDTFKGLMIIAIVFVHLFFPVTVIGTVQENVDSSLIIQTLYLCMMGFFIMAGYFYRPNRGYIENLKKRILTLGLSWIVCLFTLPLVLCIEMCFLGPNTPSFDDYIWAIRWILGTPEPFIDVATSRYYALCACATGYYFIQVMLFASIIFYAIADYSTHNEKRIIPIALGFVALTCVLVEIFGYNLPFNFSLIPIALAFMLAGAYLKRSNFVERMENGGWKTPSHIIWFVIAILALFVLVSIFPPGTMFHVGAFGLYGGFSAFPYFAESMLMFMIALFVLIPVSMIPLTKYVSKLGKYTLYILLLHMFVAKLILIPFAEMVTYAWLPEIAIPMKIALWVVMLGAPVVFMKYYWFGKSRVKARLAGRRNAVKPSETE